MILNKKQLGSIIDNLTMLQQVDGCLQNTYKDIDMTKLYHKLNDTYNNWLKGEDALDQLIKDYAMKTFKEFEGTKDECSYDECFEAAKEMYVDEIKNRIRTV
jgi:hypothetical protein